MSANNTKATKPTPVQEALAHITEAQNILKGMRPMKPEKFSIKWQTVVDEKKGMTYMQLTVNGHGFYFDDAAGVYGDKKTDTVRAMDFMLAAMLFQLSRAGYAAQIPEGLRSTYLIAYEVGYPESAEV